MILPVNLVGGPMYNLFGNIYIELQKLNDGKYSRFIDKTVDFFYGDYDYDFELLHETHIDNLNVIKEVRNVNEDELIADIKIFLEI